MFELYIFYKNICYYMNIIYEKFCYMYPSIVSILHKKVFMFILFQISIHIYISNILKQFLKIYKLYL